jgi:hypothetical protein
LPSQQLTTLPVNLATMRRRHPKTGSWTRAPRWERFDSVRTKETCGNPNLLLSHISLSIPAPCTHHDIVERIASRCQEPIAIHSLARVLSQNKLVRGKVIFGLAGDEIDKIATNYDGMHWWISKEGLNMAIVLPAAAKLSRFDEFAGKLYVDRSKDGKLSKEILLAIAKEVDVAGFALKEELQPVQWTPIREYNQKYAKEAIKTFERACQHRVSVRSIRKRLYVARERYTAAYSSIPLLPRVS